MLAKASAENPKLLASTVGVELLFELLSDELDDPCVGVGVTSVVGVGVTDGSSGVGVLSTSGVTEGVALGVLDGVGVKDGSCEGVGVTVGVAIGVTVGVTVIVGVIVGVRLGVKLGVGVVLMFYEMKHVI